VRKEEKKRRRIGQKKGEEEGTVLISREGQSREYVREKTSSGGDRTKNPMGKRERGEKDGVLQHRSPQKY